MESQSSQRSRDPKIWCGSFYRLTFRRLMSERIIPTMWGKRARISRNWATVMVGLGTVLVLVGVSLSLLMCNKKEECVVRIKVWWNLICVPSWAYLALTGFHYILWLCRVFYRLFPALFPLASK